MTNRPNWGERECGHRAIMTESYRNQALEEGKGLLQGLEKFRLVVS